MNGLLKRGGPMSVEEGLFADCGRRSCGGESPKHSPNDIDVEVESLLLPAPNRKGGQVFSEFLTGMELVEYPFVRVRPGRMRIDFLLLWSD